MAVLSVYLSPFSPDYSGVSSVLFDLNTVTAMHDASGCTGNYTGYDEPRWYGSRSPIYCSGLRELDAVLGDDEKLIRKMIAAAEDLQPELMALVGSPVPMVIGSDLTGVAEELQERTGIPCLGFDTTGTAYYDRGVALATIALLEKFTEPQTVIPGTVNLLGANPMDFGTGENLKELKRLIEEAGYEITASLSMGYTMETLKKAASAQVNLAVSRAGFLIAEYMYKTYGTPYVCGLPVGKAGKKLYEEAIRDAAQNGQPVILKEAADTDIQRIPAYDVSDKILIIGEQVQCNAIRLALSSVYDPETLVTGCLFGKEEKLSLAQDKNLSSERLIREELNRKEYRMIIADPFLKSLLGKESGAVFVEHALYAVSSKVAADRTAPIMGEQFDSWMEKQKRKKKETEER